MRARPRGFNTAMTGRVGSLRDRGSGAVAYVGLGALGAGAILGLQQAGYVDAIQAQVGSGVCTIVHTADCRTSPGTVPVGTGRNGTKSTGTGAQPQGNGWSGAGKRPEAAHRLPLFPLALGGVGVFLLFWWGVPGRLRRRFSSGKPAHRAARTRLLEVETPGQAEAADDSAEPRAAGSAPAVVIAGIDPGIAGKGMRVGVRECQITLRPGPRNTVRLDKTLAGTSDRVFATASRTVQRSLRDPGFVATLIEQTGRAATYLEGNPQLTGAAARRAELTALVGALEGIGRGQSR